MNEQQKLNINDGSGDKEYFTIVPNYILNHSTSTDQALYLQLKRLAGDGTKDYCYPSISYLRKQLKVGKESLKKSFKYIIEHNWIEDLGKRQVKTRGGYQWVNAYRLNNLWKINADYYKGGSKQADLIEEKGGLEQTQWGSETDKGGSGCVAIRRTIKEELSKEELLSNINPLIELFKPINPSYERLYANKTQRNAISRLLKNMGREKLEKIIGFLEKTNGVPFAPVITTPIQLEEKLGALMAFIGRENNKESKYIKI